LGNGCPPDGGMTQAQVSKHLGISLTTVSNWTRQGCPHVISIDGRKLYILADVFTWRLSSGKQSNLETERARLAKEQADKLEMENAVSRGELANPEDFILENMRIIGACRGKILAIPMRLSPQVVGCSNLAEVKDILERGVCECLDELAGLASVGNVKIIQKPAKVKSKRVG